MYENPSRNGIRVNLVFAVNGFIIRINPLLTPAPPPSPPPLLFVLVMKLYAMNLLCYMPHLTLPLIPP